MHKGFAIPPTLRSIFEHPLLTPFETPKPCSTNSFKARQLNSPTDRMPSDTRQAVLRTENHLHNFTSLQSFNVPTKFGTSAQQIVTTSMLHREASLEALTRPIIRLAKSRLSTPSSTIATTPKPLLLTELKTTSLYSYKDAVSSQINVLINLTFKLTD